MVIRGVSVDQTVGFWILEVVSLDGTVAFRIFQFKTGVHVNGQDRWFRIFQFKAGVHVNGQDRWFRIFQDRCACQWTGQVGSGIFYRGVHIHQSHETVPSRSL